MLLEDLWQRYRTQGYAGMRDLPLDDASAAFYRALLAFGEDDLPGAAEDARAAARLEPESALYAQGAAYLERVLRQGKAGVYVDGEAFAAFVRGGGNLGLYAAVSDALRAVYQGYETLTLLDIGVGDGMALLPALTQNITRLDVVEPSEAMLGITTRQLAEWQVPFREYNATIQDFMQIGKDDAGEGEQWDVIQATWSLQSVPPEDRPAVLDWARRHGRRLLIAEFDVPDFENLYAPERVRHIMGRYREGLAEYTDDGGQVAQGFLMPVFFGYFDRTAARTNYEVPIQQWETGLRAAGFREVRRELLYAYWWADAYLLDAR